MVILSYFFNAKNTPGWNMNHLSNIQTHPSPSYLMWSVVQCHVSRWADGTQAWHRWERQSVGVRSTVDLLHTRRTVAAPPAMMSEGTLRDGIWGSVCARRVRLGPSACDRFTRGKRPQTACIIASLCINLNVIHSLLERCSERVSSVCMCIRPSFKRVTIAALRDQSVLFGV